MNDTLLERYKIIAQIPSGFVLMHKESQEVGIYKTIYSPFDGEVQMKLMKKRQDIGSTHLLKIIDFETMDSLLTRGSKMSLIYEGWNMDLEEEVCSRSAQELFWSEDELLKLLEQALEGLQALHRQDLVHGDIKGNFIICREHGQIQIADQFGFGDQLFKTLSQVMYEKNSYLAPEIFAEVANMLNNHQQIPYQQQQEYYATKANDVFALGLVFLEASSLRSCRDLYEWEKKEFFSWQLQDRMLCLQDRYSTNLVKALQIMCEPNPTQRPDIDAVLEFVRFQAINTTTIAASMTQQSLLQTHDSLSYTQKIFIQDEYKPISNRFFDSSTKLKLKYIEAGGTIQDDISQFQHCANTPATQQFIIDTDKRSIRASSKNHCPLSSPAIPEQSCHSLVTFKNLSSHKATSSNNQQILLENKEEFIQNLYYGNQSHGTEQTIKNNERSMLMQYKKNEGQTFVYSSKLQHENTDSKSQFMSNEKETYDVSMNSIGFVSKLPSFVNQTQSKTKKSMDFSYISDQQLMGESKHQQQLQQSGIVGNKNIDHLASMLDKCLNETRILIQENERRKENTGSQMKSFKGDIQTSGNSIQVREDSNALISACNRNLGNNENKILQLKKSMQEILQSSIPITHYQFNQQCTQEYKENVYSQNKNALPTIVQCDKEKCIDINLTQLTLSDNVSNQSTLPPLGGKQYTQESKKQSNIKKLKMNSSSSKKQQKQQEKLKLNQLEMHSLVTKLTKEYMSGIKCDNWCMF